MTAAQLVAQAQAAGFTEKQAELLAAAYLVTPSTAVPPPGGPPGRHGSTQKAQQ